MGVLVFGYLEKKWKRLIRTIWVVYSTCVFLYQIFEPKLFNDDDEIIAGIIVLIPFLISYILEPFVNKKSTQITNDIDDSNLTNNKQAFDDFSKQKLLSFNFRQYFFYDGSYISGNKYWFRKLFQWPLIILGIGFYLRGVTTYTRSRSLKLSILNSILFSVYSFIIDIYIIIFIPINEKLIGVIDDMLWIYIFPVLPLTYLFFSDGKKIIPKP